MKLKQNKWVVLTDVPSDIRMIYTHGGFKPLKRYKNGLATGEIYLFESKKNASVMMNRLFDDPSCFIYIKVNVVIEASFEEG